MEEIKTDGRTVRWLPTRYKHCADILKYLHKYSESRGYMPSRREISVGCKIVVSSVNYYLGFMEQDGWIEVSKKLSRAIQITDEGRQLLAQVQDPSDGSRPEGGDADVTKISTA